MTRISKQERTKLAIGSIGNILTWYSFSLFMPFLPVISRQFFPLEDPGLRSLVSFLALSLGLFMRPVGSMIFGPISDLVGRKRALFLSTLFIAIPTVCIGLLPGYDQIGMLSPVLLLICRACQGMCLGGEYAAAMVHMVESAPTHRRGFFGSWSDVGLQIGVLGSTNSLLLLYCFFSESEIYNFAWRISFILSAILIPFAIHFYGGKEGASSSLLLSEILAEMPVEEKEKRPKKTRKIIEGLRESRQAVFCTIAVTAFSAVAFYTLFVFLPYYLEQEKILTLKESTMCSALASLSVIIAALGCGYLSDHFRRKPFIICGIIGVSAVVYTIFLLKISTLFAWIIAYICYGIFLGMYFSSRSAFFSESFPKKIRCTGVSLSISLAQAIGGGMTPIIMKFCVSASVMMSIVPATIVGIVSLAAMWKAQDRTGMELL